MPKKSSGTKPNRYSAIIEEVFKRHYDKRAGEFVFTLEEYIEIASKLGIVLPKNIPDIAYSFRHRIDLPESLKNRAKEGHEWIIEGAGKGSYLMRQVRASRILPRTDLSTIKIPDSTPEIISAYALGDEQALLAKVRYNRLIDIFLSITAFSLQNHLRTTVTPTRIQKGLKKVKKFQIEIDEVYVGLDRNGRQFVVPVQAKGGSDKLGVVQTSQDIAWCRERLPNLICRPVSAQFTSNGRIAMFELTIEDDEVKIITEKHYQLVPSKEITESDLRTYAERTN